MKALNFHEAMSAIARNYGKPVLYLSFDPDQDLDQTVAAAPYLKDLPMFGQLIADAGGYIVCDSDEEMEELFWQTVGDDGPTASNPYLGKGRIYALTCGDDGQLRNENT